MGWLLGLLKGLQMEQLKVSQMAQPRGYLWGLEWGQHWVTHWECQMALQKAPV